MKFIREHVMWWVIAGAFLLMVVALLSSCGVQKNEEPFKDAPRGNTNDSRADVIEMPDGFSNAATKCDHGNRIYVIFKHDSAYGSIAVVPNAPDCQNEP